MVKTIVQLRDNSGHLLPIKLIDNGDGTYVFDVISAVASVDDTVTYSFMDDFGEIIPLKIRLGTDGIYQFVKKIDPIYWYKPASVSLDSIVGAYKFSGKASQPVALWDESRTNGFDLVANQYPVLFDLTTGFTFNGTSEYLLTQEFDVTENTSFIFKYTDLIGNNPPSYVYNLMGGTNNSGIQFVYNQQDGEGIWSVGIINDGNASTSLASIVTSGIIALTKDGVYLDGVLYKAFSTPPTPFSIHTAMAIAAKKTPSNVQQFCKVNMRAAAIYNRTLTNSEVATISDAMTDF